METDVIETEIGDTIGMVDDPSDGAKPTIYEVGYNLLGSLSEDQAVSGAGAVQAILKSEAISFVGEHAPVKISLAYTITKKVNGRNERFDSAYFGWVAFEALPEAVVRIQAALEAEQNILRFILVRTSRDAVAAAQSGAVEAPVLGNIEKPKREAEAGGEVSEAALEQALQSMATEDAKTAE